VNSLAEWRPGSLETIRNGVGTSCARWRTVAGQGPSRYAGRNQRYGRPPQPMGLAFAVWSTRSQVKICTRQGCYRDGRWNSSRGTSRTSQIFCRTYASNAVDRPAVGLLRWLRDVDIACEELSSWSENGESCRRLEIRFPDSIATHSSR
jgi:hypothetical protein